MAHGRIYIIPAYATAKGVNIYFLRVAIVSEYMTSADVQVTLEAIQQSACRVLKTHTARAEESGDCYMPIINNEACPAAYRGRANGETGVGRKLANGETPVGMKLANGETGVVRKLASGETPVGMKLANGETGVDRKLANGETPVGMKLANGETGVDRKLASGETPVGMKLANKETPVDKKLANRNV